MATSQSIEQWKAWLDDAQEYRQDWQHMAERSWQEIKKQQKNGRFWSVTPNTSRKNVKFQLWWSTYKIRQPIYYSRTPIPIGKDTVGNDPVGRTAAICLERLSKAVLKTFDFDRAIESARDDFLVGNLSQTRAFFSCDYIKEKEKKRVEQVAEDKIVDEQGNDVDVKLVQQDEDGLYIESEKEVDVENERVWIEPVLYTDFYVDPDARNWDKARRIAFAFDYPKDEFIEVFGRGALSALTEQSEKKVGKSRTLIRVYECWDSYAREVVWVPECGDDFITPLSEKEIEPDLYKLERFYPCPAPLIANAPTDNFYPIPEYYELQDLIEEMHLIFSRIMQLCRAIRVRALYDANVAELAPLVNEASEADFIGVPNLAQSLAAGQGNLSNLVAYLNVAPLIEGLNNMYTALEQRVNLFYQLTGISDLLRGQTDPNETYGAQQLKGKFAMNRIADDQRKLQEFCRANLELLTEMAIKNFKDETLARYIVPETLDDEDKQRYPAAIEMLKNDRKRRFRIELETDSTIALNEEYDKAMRVEVVNALTTALEKTAQVAQQDPALAIAELKMLQHLARGFRQGKVFEDEIEQAINAAIERMQQAQQQPPPPDVNAMKAQADMERLKLDREIATADAQLRGQDAAMRQQKEQAELMLEREIKSAEIQVEAQKLAQGAQAMQIDAQKALQEAQIKQSELQLRYQELLTERERIAMEAQKAGNDALLAQTRTELDGQIAASDARLEEMALQIKAYETQMSEREKLMTEERLQFEAQLKALETGQRAAAEMQQRMQQTQAQQAPQIAPKIEIKMPRSVSKPVRDEEGNIVSVETIPVADDDGE